MEEDVDDESEGREDLFGVGDSEQIIERNDKGGRYLARRAVEKSTRARYTKSLPVGREAEDSDAPNSPN